MNVVLVVPVTFRNVLVFNTLTVFPEAIVISAPDWVAVNEVISASIVRFVFALIESVFIDTPSFVLSVTLVAVAGTVSVARDAALVSLTVTV